MSLQGFVLTNPKEGLVFEWWFELHREGHHLVVMRTIGDEEVDVMVLKLLDENTCTFDHDFGTGDDAEDMLIASILDFAAFVLEREGEPSELMEEFFGS